MPIAWSELAKLTRADAFTMKDVPAKLARRRTDPWANINTIQQNLARWAQDD
jgi:bifunctional non-homologous end joining protein LigD